MQSVVLCFILGLNSDQFVKISFHFEFFLPFIKKLNYTQHDTLSMLETGAKQVEWTRVAWVSPSKLTGPSGAQQVIFFFNIAERFLNRLTR